MVTREVLSVIKFVAAIYDAVGHLKKSIEWMQTSRQNSNALLQGRVHATTPRECNGQYFHSWKGGTVPQELADRFNALLSLTSVQLINQALNGLVEGVQGDEIAITQDL